jgi:hypothetical protein
VRMSWPRPGRAGGAEGVAEVWQVTRFVETSPARCISSPPAAGRSREREGKSSPSASRSAGAVHDIRPKV